AARGCIRAGHLRLEHGAHIRPPAPPRDPRRRKAEELPFIMVTAESKTENVVTAKHAGGSNPLSSRSTRRRSRRRSRACSALSEADVWRGATIRLIGCARSGPAGGGAPGR